MSQEVSKWLVNGLLHLLINGLYIGVITHLPTIDPNFQWDIQLECNIWDAKTPKIQSWLSVVAKSEKHGKTRKGRHGALNT